MAGLKGSTRADGYMHLACDACHPLKYSVEKLAQS